MREKYWTRVLTLVLFPHEGTLRCRTSFLRSQPFWIQHTVHLIAVVFYSRIYVLKFDFEINTSLGTLGQRCSYLDLIVKNTCFLFQHDSEINAMIFKPLYLKFVLFFFSSNAFRFFLHDLQENYHNITLFSKTTNKQ